MDSPAGRSAETRTANVKLSIGGNSIEMQLSVPAGPVRPAQLLPVLQSLTNAVVEIATDAVEAEGKRISCQAGCGACCRQLVPISEVEAGHIAELVENLPEPRRSEIRARFAEAEERIAAAGMLEGLSNTQSLEEGGLQALGMDYFRLGIPCPFLEQESCSIHPDRPLSCREYLVTSPAEHCREPSAATIDQVPIPVKISRGLLRFELSAGQRVVDWVPLSLAPRWAKSHPPGPPRYAGPELVQEIFQHLTGQNTAPAESPRNDS